MEIKDTVFQCDEIWRYDDQINEESHKKIKEWIENNSEIKIGDIVEKDNKKFAIIDIDLCGSQCDFSFLYHVKPVNKSLKIIENRRSFTLLSVVKDGVMYRNPSYSRQIYSPAQLRFNDYFYRFRSSRFSC